MVLRPLYSSTVTGKDLMLRVTSRVIRVKISQKQESVSSATMKTIAISVTLESGLVLVDCMITTIHVATKLDILQTTATSI